MTILPPSEAGLAAAAAAIRAGEVVAYPTETVYGLGVDPFNESALERLFTVKGRPESNPIVLIIAEVGQLGTVVSEVSSAAQSCIDQFWPGPLSLVLPRVPGLPDAVTAGGDKVSVRCPGSEVAQALCRLVGGPITSTSANRSGEPPAVSLEGLDLPGIAVAIDGGVLPPSLPSTVYDPDTGQIHRQGAIPEDILLRQAR